MNGRLRDGSERQLSSPSSSSNPHLFSHLPMEIILQILYESANSSSTNNARNVCLVSKIVYNECWPTLWRIISLRNAIQLKRFSEFIYQPPFFRNFQPIPPTDIDQQLSRNFQSNLRKRQNSVRFLYLNNNKDANGIRSLRTDEKPEMWMISILLAVRNLEILHVEEYWSASYPWEAQEDKPLIAYPVFLLSRFFTAVHAAFVSSPKSQWVRKMFGDQRQEEEQPAQLILNDVHHQNAFNMSRDEDFIEPVQSNSRMDIYDAIIELQRTESLRRSPPRLIAQLHEITLSALAMSPNHLTRIPPALAPGHNRLPNNEEAFDKLSRLHLNFAKLDNRMLEALMDLPALTHLRLTRPFSELLYDGSRTLLGYGSEPSLSTLKAGGRKFRLSKLMVEGGIYMDRTTVQRMKELQSSHLGRGRLVFLQSQLYPTGPNRAAETGTIIGEGEGGESSTARIVNFVTTSEERGFQNFVDRAHGLAGVWSASE